MLLNLHKKTWMDGLTLAEYSEHSRLNENIVSEMLELAKNYNKVRRLREIPRKLVILSYVISNVSSCTAMIHRTCYRLWKRKRK